MGAFPGGGAGTTQDPGPRGVMVTSPAQEPQPSCHAVGLREEGRPGRGGETEAGEGHGRPCPGHAATQRQVKREAAPSLTRHLLHTCPPRHGQRGRHHSAMKGAAI